jgi:hypothetical protein
MPTTTGVTSKVTIFDPIISINGVDVGFITDKLTIDMKYTTAKYESGIPKNLRKTMKNAEELTCKFDFSQTSLGNFQSALNLPTSSLVSTSIITLGGDSSQRLLTLFSFQGTDDAGNQWNVEFYKAAITEIGSFAIDADFMKIPVTVTAVADLTRVKGDQLARLIRS